MKFNIRKMAGLLLIWTGVALCGVAAIAMVSLVFFSPPNTPNIPQGFMVIFVIFGLPIMLLFAGGYICLPDKAEHKKGFVQKFIKLFSFVDEKEITATNPNNPPICHSCNRDYDKTWKICLKCGKSLAEK